MRRLLTLLLILLSCSVFAQQRLLVMGEIRSAKDSLPLDEVVVICKDPQRETHSDKKGHYAILIDQKAGQTLEFRLMSYKTVRVKVEPKKGDTLFISVWMQPDFITMKEFTLSSGPDTVIGNWRFFIEDYLFLNDSQYVLLTFEKSLKNAKVMLATENKIVASTAVPCEAKELYRDYQGHINVMCKDSAFRVKIVPPAIVLLLALPYTDFCDRMLPCIDTLGGRILFSNYHRN